MALICFMAIIYLDASMGYEGAALFFRSWHCYGLSRVGGLHASFGLAPHTDLHSS